VNRPTEFRALFNLFLATQRSYADARRDFTSRQEQAVEYAIEALRRGVNAAKYVAKKLGIALVSAYQLLQRADFRAKMHNFSQFVEYVSKDATQNTWTPTPEAIQRQMASMSRECAASGTEGCHGHTRGDYALCWSCLRKYGLRGEWVDKPHAWLIPEARRIQTQHRLDAINALYEDWRAGRVDVIEDEALPMAA